MPRALTIAGSDSSGGAGLQADLKTFAGLGVYGASVVTAVTAQNTRAVTAIHAIPPAIVAAQIDAVFDDLRIDAVKLGMLGQVDVIQAVGDRLAAHRPRWVVLDPVMISQSGAALLQPDAVAALMALFPLATVITPNLPECAVLLGTEVPGTPEGMAEAARQLGSLGPAVLVKGGHRDGTALDVLYDGEIHLFEQARLPTHNTHGTGCSLASAIAAHLAHGYALPAAVGLAKTWLTGAIGAADQLDVGRGHGPVHHFWRGWSPAG